MKTFIVPTSQALHLTKNLKKKFEIVLPDLNREGARYFPDGEVYAAISKAGKLRKGRVVLLYSGSPDPNAGLMELELVLQILRDNKIFPEVFFSYFPYGMQDNIFDKGETNAARNLVQKLVDYYKVKKIYVIDAHFWGRDWAKHYPIENISATPILLKNAKKEFGNDVLFLSPDKGGKRRTKISGFKKKRVNSFIVEMAVSKKNLQGKTVAVVDDVIKTGGTLVKFAESAKSAGAKQVLALATHGVLDSGILRTKSAFKKLYLTNTINKKEANINISSLIAEVLN